MCVNALTGRRDFPVSISPVPGQGPTFVVRERPLPNGSGSVFYRSAGACPPRALGCADDGEGQALALREREAFFTVARGPVPRERAFFYRSAGACPPRSPSSRCRLRSFRTYMSIAIRVVPFSRSFRTLIKTRAALAKSIKDLKDLSVLRGRAGYRH